MFPPFIDSLLRRREPPQCAYRESERQAWALLKPFLTKEQRRTALGRGYIDVGEVRLYLDGRAPYNLSRRISYCIHEHYTMEIPGIDRVLVFKLLLETDPHGFFVRANPFVNPVSRY